MAEPTSLLLGLEGLEVTAVTRGTDRSRVVDVVTADRRAAHCPQCKVASSSVKGHAVTRPRDIRYGDDPIMLRWTKTRYYCVNPACERRSFTESILNRPGFAGGSVSWFRPLLGPGSHGSW
ncbi:hypothetical protein Gbro_0368 [Gordonia bronchialis DSM 43247]|uniref:Transposase IS204/IS1001/IS1096/IS1165 zinc-finger domain-containing protein n=1 Tax=Gordonia bronchialis (strain ATCC 25592 / DSM 43247 / BCRC 13721 / JCM 3198 / KCTC 3076 / NBRC 16047 / NCTC 10667) TaxID=526226 RepID=D0LD82_GORB4|nr:hypothetical protein Gbro_0368 [Gordonia bronchialis DSM 43247]MCC3322480.1 transposase family protein [Gordonia bronchialis]QGS26401.1 transposase family protein [Gordonia bronchialis]STQ62473.1 Transposase and inactivated derivatives [Gordonia bronchialis]